MKKSEKDILEMGKEKLEQLKTVFEELEVQLSLGKKEAQEAFEREKKNFQEYIDDQKERFKEEKEKAESHRQDLLRKLEALQAALSVAPPATQQEYPAYKDKLLQAVYELEAAIKEGYDRVRFSVRERLDLFKAKLDAFRIQLALSDFDKKDEPDRKREEVKEAATSILEMLNQEAERGDKVENFVEEVNASFDHLKKAFTELFS